MSGCESSSNSNVGKKSQKSAIIQKQIKAVPVKQKQRPMKIAKVAKTKPASQATSSKPEKEKSPVLGNEGNDQNQQPLDLSLPLEIPNTQIATNELNANKSKYLPDLFSKKTPENRSLQIQGNLIKREEEAIEKDRVVDGAEIKIKLIN